MNIVMAGIDYKTADVAVREQFSLTSAQVSRQVAQIAAAAPVSGCVLLSTCNRTELYVSGGLDVHPAQLLCDSLGLDYASFAPFFTERRERAAAMHLMMVASGLRSQVRGEDQILTQVKHAIAVSRQAKASDNALETLFRCAVTAAKKVKTTVPIAPVESSVAQRAVHALREAVGTLAGKHVMVIGNGEMGRLMDSLLLAQGCRVTVTIRSYKRGEVVVPPDCRCIPYEERYAHMPGCDIVVSATTSPHFTVRAQQVQELRHFPRYWVDLAVPRDIDPALSQFEGAVCWNVDTLGGGAMHTDREKLMQVHEILKEHVQRFEQWRSYSALLPTIQEIASITAGRVENTVLRSHQLAPEQEQLAEQVIQQSVQRTVELLLLSLRDTLDQQSLLACKQRLQV